MKQNGKSGSGKAPCCHSRQRKTSVALAESEATRALKDTGAKVSQKQQNVESETSRADWGDAGRRKKERGRHTCGCRCSAIGGFTPPAHNPKHSDKEGKSTAGCDALLVLLVSVSVLLLLLPPPLPPPLLLLSPSPLLLLLRPLLLLRLLPPLLLLLLLPSLL